MFDSKSRAMQVSVNPETEVHPVEVRVAMEKGEELVLVDVRNPREWNFCRIEGSVFAALPELEVKAKSELQPLKAKRVVVVCHHGRRSLHGAEILRRYGFENVRSMAGGIDAWSVLVDGAVARY